MERSLLKREQAELSQNICRRGPAPPAGAAAMPPRSRQALSCPGRESGSKQPKTELHVALRSASTLFGFNNDGPEPSVPPAGSREPLPALPPAPRRAPAGDACSGKTGCI